MTEHRILVVGPLGTNCHLIWNRETDRGIVVDPAAEADYIIGEIGKCGFTPEVILLTHAHVDHIGAIPELVARFGIPVWLHAGDRQLYHSSANCLMPWVPQVEGLPETTDVIPEIPGLTFDVIHTPGHTPGGCSFHFANDGFLLSGDTLFAGSIGRTDFPGGSEPALLSSIREKLFVLPGATVVYPGHGQRTTIAIEKMSPFFD